MASHLRRHRRSLAIRKVWTGKTRNTRTLSRAGKEWAFERGSCPAGGLQIAEVEKWHGNDSHYQRAAGKSH